MEKIIIWIGIIASIFFLKKNWANKMLSFPQALLTFSMILFTIEFSIGLILGIALMLLSMAFLTFYAVTYSKNKILLLCIFIPHLFSVIHRGMHWPGVTFLRLTFIIPIIASLIFLIKQKDKPEIGVVILMFCYSIFVFTKIF